MITLAMFNIVYIIYCLLLVAILAAIALAGLVCLFLCIKCRGTIRWMSGLGAIFLAAFAWYFIQVTDPYVRSPVSAAKLVGIYQIEPDRGAGALSAMHYEGNQGRLELAADGTFTASLIPACCLSGKDESAYPEEAYPHGYYTFSGSWKTVPEKPIFSVNLRITQAHFSRDVGGTAIEKPLPPYVELKVMKSPSLSLLLSFQVFNGDFYDVTLSKK